MAKAASSVSAGSKKKDSANVRKAKAQSPSEKEARKRKASEPEPEVPVDAPLLDDKARRDIWGIVFVVLAVALLIIVLLPTNGVITSFLSLAIKMTLGVGAYVLPPLLAVIGISFFARINNRHVPARLGIGLSIIFVAFLVFLALFTPTLPSDGAVSSYMFNDHQLVTRGGYVGAAIAWLLLTLFGLPVSCIITAGIVAIGLVIVGFSLSKIIALVKDRRAKAAAAAAEEEERNGVLLETPLMPHAGDYKRNQRLGDAAETQLLSRWERKRDSAPNGRVPRAGSVSSAETVALGNTASQRGDARQTKPLTRRIGQNNADAEKKTDTKAAPTVDLNRTSNGEEGGYVLPSMSLLKVSKGKKRSKAAENELSMTAARLQQTLEDFGIMANVVDWVAGPTVTLFEIDLPPGVRVSRVTALNDDIALALAAPGVRIFAPIPGTHYVGIEVPNATRENVLLGDVLKDATGGPLEMAIGKDVEGNSIICDLAKMPHLLIGGTTGSGKSVGINSMIMSMLMRATPDQVRFIMIDPKRVEFTPYNGIPHLYVPVVTEPKEAASALSWGVAEMERRLKVFSKAGARNIAQYNEMVQTGEIEDESAESLPYIVIIIDELADLMMNVGKEVEFSISRIAQLARAAGIHLIVATQRPSANVVTGLIKANITNRISFNVASGLDSRVILDVSGAESLIGNGDMLLSQPELAKPLRVQGCFVSSEEINNVVAAVKEQGSPEYHSEILKTNLITLGDSKPDGSGGTVSSDDPLLWDAADIIVASGMGSTSNIQRKLHIGYSRAGRIIDQLEEKGVVGPSNGSKPREVLVDAMELESLKAFEQSDSLESEGVDHG